MKKTISLLLVLILLFSLCACTSKREETPAVGSSAAFAVVDQINALFPLSLESGSAIAAAENAYRALTESEQKAVSNVLVLDYARDSFRRITEVSNGIAALSAHPTLTDVDTYQTLVLLYNSLSEEEQNAVANASALDEIVQKLNDKLGKTGSWVFYITLSSFQRLNLEELLGEDHGLDVVVPYVLELYDDGTCSLSVNYEEFIDYYVNFANTVVERAQERMYESYRQQGFSDATAEKAFEKDYGKPSAEYFSERVLELLPYETLNTDLLADGAYYDFDGDRLYVRATPEWDESSYFTAQFGDGTLTLSDGQGLALDLIPAELLPVTFTAVNN